MAAGGITGIITGGITGNISNASISYCVNRGTVNSNSFTVGGIAGTDDDENCTIQYCENRAISAAAMLSAE